MNPYLCSQPNLNTSDQPLERGSHRISLLQKVKTVVTRQVINEGIIELHDHALTRLQPIGMIAQAIDKKEFSEPEFLFFIDIKNCFSKGVNEYRGLNRSLRLLQVAIEAQNSFFNIEQIESVYRSQKQQELYNLVFDLLSRNVTNHYFHKKVHEKFTEILPHIETNKGKKALTAYMRGLDAIAKQDKLGLKLLFLFKKHNLTDYSILRTVSSIIRSLQSQNLRDFNYIIQIVNRYYYIFERLGRIIGVPTTRANAKAYGLMLQYLTLRHKYQKIYLQFAKMLKILKDWQKIYLIVEDIRYQHPVLKYKQPPEFKAKLPGINVYRRYKSYLT